MLGVPDLATFGLVGSSMLAFLTLISWTKTMGAMLYPFIVGRCTAEW